MLGDDAQARASSSARIERMCQSASDARTLRLETLNELRRVVPFDAYAWVLTDPATAVGVSPLADVPWLPQLPTQIRLKYLTPVNRWTALGDDSVGLLHETTGGDLGQSRLWRELLVDYGVGDVASVVIKDQFGCWAFLELWRIDAANIFTSADASLLRALTRPLSQALRRCQQRGFVVRAATPLQPSGPVMLLLSPDLTVLGQTPESMEYLRQLVPPDDDRLPVPAAAYNVGAQLLANEAGVDDNPPMARVALSDGILLTVRAARIGGSGAAVEGNIAVTIEASSAADRLDLFGRAFGLSARERELLSHLVGGNDTRDVARLMFLSENTVQDHVKSIFAKTSSRSRRTLLARVLGT